MARRLTDAQRLQNNLTEREFQKAYVAAARSLGFFVEHHYDSRFSDPGTKGAPDLKIVGHGHFMAVEMKREKGSPSPEQIQWIEEYQRAGINVYVYRPSDWELMMDQLEEIAQAGIDPLLRRFPTPKKR